jgi:hypothetical protein
MGCPLEAGLNTVDCVSAIVTDAVVEAGAAIVVGGVPGTTAARFFTKVICNTQLRTLRAGKRNGLGKREESFLCVWLLFDGRTYLFLFELGEKRAFYLS